MAASKPILGVLESGSEVRCLIEDTHGGLCCEPGEYDKVEENLRWFIDNAGSEELKAMGARGRENLEKNLTRNVSVRKYQVSVTRKKVWLCELEMATWFCNVCEKYGLSYFLIGGSAIGAVRHNGFIPWDDDLDIGMLRSDFDKFRKVSIRELPSNYKIEYGVLKNKVFSSLLRIRNNDTTGIIVDEYEQALGDYLIVGVTADDFDKTRTCWI